MRNKLALVLFFATHVIGIALLIAGVVITCRELGVVGLLAKDTFWFLLKENPAAAWKSLGLQILGFIFIVFGHASLYMMPRRR